MEYNFTYLMNRMVYLTQTVGDTALNTHRKYLESRLLTPEERGKIEEIISDYQKEYNLVRRSRTSKILPREYNIYEEERSRKKAGDIKRVLGPERYGYFIDFIIGWWEREKAVRPKWLKKEREKLVSSGKNIVYATHHTLDAIPDPCGYCVNTNHLDWLYIDECEAEMMLYTAKSYTYDIFCKLTGKTKEFIKYMENGPYYDCDRYWRDSKCRKYKDAAPYEPIVEKVYFENYNDGFAQYEPPMTPAALDMSPKTSEDLKLPEGKNTWVIVGFSRMPRCAKTIDGCYGQPTLRRHSRNNCVKLIQKILKKIGYDIKIDGDFGRKTEEVVKDFQKKHNLKVDGVVGKDTWKESLKYR